MRTNQIAVTTQSNMPDLDTAECTFDADGIGHIMDILSNMYTNAMDAILREYPANGFDSHVRAGITRPVEVTLPSALQPTLLVQDYGLGLSKDEIINVYSKYGKSTKNDTDDEIGGFGIGAKSAFTKAQQFIVTGVKDGQKTVAIFALNEYNRGTVTIAWEGPTDEPNGVLVSLGVDDIEEAQAAAARVYRTWPKGSILVNGREPESVFDHASWINDDTAIVQGDDSTIYVCAGAVAYPVGAKVWERVAKRLDPSQQGTIETLISWSNKTEASLFFRVGIQDVHVHPSREALRDSDKTLATLETLVRDLHEVVTNEVQTKMAAAPSKFAAHRVYLEAKSAWDPFTVERKAVDYKGVRFRHDILVDLPVLTLDKKTWNSSVQVVRQHFSLTVTPDSAEKVLVVCDIAEADHSKIKRYAKRFLENSKYSYVVLSKATAASYDWFQYGIDTGADTMTLTEYRAALREMNPASVRNSNGPSYSTGIGATASRNLADRDSLEEIISWGKDIVIFHDRVPAGRYASKALDEYTCIALLATQSEDALRKRVAADGSVEVVDVDVPALIQAAKQADIDDITDDERWAYYCHLWHSLATGYGYGSYGREWLAWSDVLADQPVTSTRIKEVADLIHEIGKYSHTLDNLRRKEISGLLTAIPDEKVVEEVGAEFPTQFGDAYPLLDNVSNYRLERNPSLLADVVEYVNTKG